MIGIFMPRLKPFGLAIGGLTGRGGAIQGGGMYRSFLAATAVSDDDGVTRKGERRRRDE